MTTQKPARTLAQAFAASGTTRYPLPKLPTTYRLQDNLVVAIAICLWVLRRRPGQ